MQRWFLFIGSVLGLLGVMAGAYAAHGLEKIVESPEMIATFDTGARYQIYHALALCVVAWRCGRSNGDSPPRAPRLAVAAGLLFVLGVLLFSGSLYVLVLTGVTRWGAVTPVGGLCLLVGWALLAASAIWWPARVQ